MDLRWFIALVVVHVLATLIRWRGEDTEGTEKEGEHD